jgi:hypothetical protein
MTAGGNSKEVVAVTKRVFSVGLALTLLIFGWSGVRGQAVLYPLDSPNAQGGGYFGSSVSRAEDVNGDGHPDIIVGAPGEAPGISPDRAGRAYVFDGSGGGVLHTLLSPNPEAYGSFGGSVSGIGDLNDDGYCDVVVGAWCEEGGALSAGRAYLFSGQDGSVLHTLESADPEQWGHFGYSVSNAGDVNGDGYSDAIVGAWREDGGAADAGRAYVFSGADGGFIRTLQSPSPVSSGRFGWSVSGAGDVDGDGCGDMVVGAYNYGESKAYVFSGQGDSLILALSSPSSSWLGWSVATAGDVNGDGYADVAVGAPQSSVFNSGDGRAHVFTGDGGGALHSWWSPHSCEDGFFGGSVSCAGDVDGDGHPDVAVGAPFELIGYADGAGHAYVFSGQSGALLLELRSQFPQHEGEFGSSISGIGDVNNDGHPEVIVGAPGEYSQGYAAGRAYVFTSAVVLSGYLSSGQLVLEWSALLGAAGYWIYGAPNRAHFEPVLSWPYWYRQAAVGFGVTMWSSTAGIGDPDYNWTYLVIVVDAADQELARSNRVGEFDYSTGPQLPSGPMITGPAPVPPLNLHGRQ